MSKELLRKSPLFCGLDEEDLERLYDSARRIRLGPGDVLMTEGEDGAAAYLAIDGIFEVTKHSGDREYVIDQRVAGDFMGEISLLENALRTATVHAATDTEVLESHARPSRTFFGSVPAPRWRFCRRVRGSRLRHSEVTLRQSEKMASLGTLSAGLAHELNNPAAAVQRSAAQLREAMAGLKHSPRARRRGLLGHTGRPGRSIPR